jgi:hypothetical protein
MKFDHYTAKQKKKRHKKSSNSKKDVNKPMNPNKPQQKPPQHVPAAGQQQPAPQKPPQGPPKPASPMKKNMKKVRAVKSSKGPRNNSQLISFLSLSTEKRKEESQAPEKVTCWHEGRKTSWGSTRSSETSCLHVPGQRDRGGEPKKYIRYLKHHNMRKDTLLSTRVSSLSTHQTLITILCNIFGPGPRLGIVQAQ